MKNSCIPTVNFLRKFSLAIFILLFSCSEQEDADVEPVPEPIVDNSEVSAIKVFPGRNRIKISWHLKPDVNTSNVKLYWNSKSDSLEIPVRTSADTMEVMLTNMEEGDYAFKLYTSDGTNPPTYKLNVSGTVYGDIYEDNLQNRGISSTTVSKEMNIVDWQIAEKQAIAVDLKYTDNTATLQEIRTKASTATTLLESYPAGTFFQYRTLYLPELNALDTFYTAYTSSKGATTYKSTITRAIAKNSELIETVLSDTLIELHPGVDQASLHYKGQDGRLITLYVVAADLTNQKIAVRAATPNDSPEFSRQVVSEIARFADALNNRVLAAVNGDFFVNSIPQGVVVKKGQIIKSDSRSDAGYFGIFKNGTPVISGYDHFQVNKENIQEALGGYHMLIKSGAKVQQGDTSVEPRTIVGYTGSNMVYFVVIDGRQTGYSLGMSFAQASDLLAALEVKEGINLDGGGSSTLVVKDFTTGSWKVQNRPSDGSERAVANGWTIVSTE